MIVGTKDGQIIRTLIKSLTSVARESTILPITSCSTSLASLLKRQELAKDGAQFKFVERAAIVVINIWMYWDDGLKHMRDVDERLEKLHTILGEISCDGRRKPSTQAFESGPNVELVKRLEEDSRSIIKSVGSKLQRANLDTTHRMNDKPEGRAQSDWKHVQLQREPPEREDEELDKNFDKKFECKQEEEVRPSEKEARRQQKLEILEEVERAKFQGEKDALETKDAEQEDQSKSDRLRREHLENLRHQRNEQDIADLRKAIETMKINNTSRSESQRVETIVRAASSSSTRARRRSAHRDATDLKSPTTQDTTRQYSPWNPFVNMEGYVRVTRRQPSYDDSTTWIQYHNQQAVPRARRRKFIASSAGYGDANIVYANITDSFNTEVYHYASDHIPVRTAKPRRRVIEEHF